MRKENGYLGILMVSHRNEHPFLLYLKKKTLLFVLFITIMLEKIYQITRMNQKL